MFLGTYSFPSPLTTPKDYESLSTPLPSEALPKLLLGMDSGIRIEEKTTFVAENLHHKRLLLKIKNGNCCWLWTALIKISRRWIFFVGAKKIEKIIQQRSASPVYYRGITAGSAPIVEGKETVSLLVTIVAENTTYTTSPHHLY